MSGFEQYARYLQHPLTLIGFVLLVFFGVHRALLRSGIIPKVSAQSGSKIVQALLRYGFIIALAIIVLGFGLEFFKTAHNKSLKPEDVLKVTTGLTDYYLRSQQQRDAAYLNSVSDEQRQQAASSTREVEEILSRSGMKLSPEELTGLGYAYLLANEMDKSKTALLDAVKDNPSLGIANELLAVVNQLRASDDLQKGDFNSARETLKAAEQYAEAARHDRPADTSIGSQLGFIYKDMAQHDLANHDQASANEELAKAKELFQARLGVKPDDPGPHNGLGSVYYLSGDLDNAIAEQRKAVKLANTYTYAWHDLAADLAEKYCRDQPPNSQTLRQLNEALDVVFALQQVDGVEKLPPAHLAVMEKMRSNARSGKVCQATA